MARLTLAILVAKTDKIKALRKPADKFTNTQLHILLVVLKCASNRALTMLKKDMQLHLTKWDARGVLSADGEVTVITAEAV